MLRAGHVDELATAHVHGVVRLAFEKTGLFRVRCVISELCGTALPVRVCLK